MGEIRDFKDLRVWQSAIDLVEDVYRLTRMLPREELDVLTAQMRRAAVAVPSNIAEGYARDTRQQYMHFLSIARGSLKELETQLLVASRAECCTAADAASRLDLLDQTARLFQALLRSLTRNAGRSNET